MTTKSRAHPIPRLFAGLAAFALLCGVIIVLAAEPIARAEREPTLEDRVTRALHDARRAERALMDANYGEAEQHLRRLDRTLSDILDRVAAD